MSYVDIFCLVIIALGFLTGFSGKASKRFFSLIFTCGALVGAYFTYNMVYDFVYALDGTQLVSTLGVTLESGVEANVGNVLLAFIKAQVEAMGIPGSAVNGIVVGLLQLIIFWVETIVLDIALQIVGGIIVSIFAMAEEKGTAKRTFGIFGLLRGAVVSVIILIPVLCLNPLLKEVSSIVEGDIGVQVQEQVSTSKVVEFSDKLVLSKYKLNFMKYEMDGGKEGYLYDDVKSLKTALKMKDVFIPAEGEEVNAVEVITSLSDDDLRELAGSEAVSEIVGGLVSSMVPDIKVEDFDLANEVEAIIVVKNIVELDESGNITGVDMSDVKTEDLVNACATSDLVPVIADMAPGALSSVDASTKSDIESQLQAKVTGGEISQDKMNSIMQLFNAK